MSLTREKIQDGIADTTNEKSVVKPYVMSHGTMECYSLKESRKFYEEFLGLECVRHAKPAMVVRCGLKFHIVAVEVGAAVHPQNVLNHWGLDVGSKAEVDRVHKAATANKDKYKIRQVLPWSTSTACTPSTWRTSTTTGGRCSTTRASRTRTSSISATASRWMTAPRSAS